MEQVALRSMWRGLFQIPRHVGRDAVPDRDLYAMRAHRNPAWSRRIGYSTVLGSAMQIRSVEARSGMFRVESQDGDVFAHTPSATSLENPEFFGAPTWSGGVEPGDAAQRIEASHKAALELASRSTIGTRGSSVN